MREMANKVALDLKVNGKRHRLQVKPWHTLLEVLRDSLGLTGAKRGCDDGTCGTCTVNLNGAMARACRIPIDRAQGSKVLTIEGLADSGDLHPLQRAFLSADAVQCGFCTPGMIMAAKALLDRNPNPAREEIVKALGSNLCRCTGYVSILDAIERAANNGGEPPSSVEWNHPEHHRADALDKVRGKALYAADLTMAGMLHGAVVRSPHAHAEVLDVDATDARALPGVVAVVTAQDVPGLNRHGRAIKDQPVLADDRVRQVGDPVAAVAATSPEAAAQAASLVKVRYRVLPEVLEPSAAMEEGAPQVHEGGNLLSERVMSWGDVDSGLAEAELVVDETYTTPWIEHAYLEPEAALAYSEIDGTLVVRLPIQYSFMLRRAVAETMDLLEEQVRIVPTVVGGAFGGKNDASYACITALLALKTKRPVKLVYSRAESFANTTKRHPFRIRCRTGVTRDGRLTALDAEMVADTGAYASSGPSVFIRSGVSMASPYDFPNVSIRGKAVYTNNLVAGSFRGFGAPQSVFALESQMDIMAGRLGMDPLEFRRMNRRSSSDSEATPQKLEQESSYDATLEAVLPHYRTARENCQAAAHGDGQWRRGVGIASMRYGIGSAAALLSPGRVSLELQADGRIRIRTGVMELGQGSDTAMQLIVARKLALPPESISVESGDTATTTDSGTSGGSRVTYYVGNAAHDGATRLKAAILSTASELLEQPAGQLELKDGRVALAETGDVPVPAVTLAEVAQAMESAGTPLRVDGIFDPTPLILESGDGALNPFPVYVSATQLAEVEVNIDSGEVRVIRVVAAHDVGRVVFPLGLKGQIEGSVAMGLGFALKEEFRPGETLGFKQYRIPNTRDMPEVVTLLVEGIDPSADLGAKGAAECALVPSAPAIANAIADATGIRIHDLPATPLRLKALLAQTRVKDQQIGDVNHG